MCTNAYLPAGTSKEEALAIMQNMFPGNMDGTGVGYIKNNKFVIRKYPYSFDKVMKRHPDFLDFLPHDGWVLLHNRFGTLGSVSEENCHPFNIDNKFIGQHNGIFGEPNLLKLAIGDRCNFKGETDSEICLNLIKIIGAERFALEMEDNAGVFGILNLDGTLEIAKVSGCLDLIWVEGQKAILASEFDNDVYNKENGKEQFTCPDGYFLFDKEGNWVRNVKKPKKVYKSYIPKSYHSDTEAALAHWYSGE